ncbi:MAG: hypothetical protein K0Q71_4537, partial [Thermomicrobiales bacterium]|nr:hypothetical protein [Thermomicrobiales bacterium]
GRRISRRGTLGFQRDHDPAECVCWRTRITFPKGTIMDREHWFDSLNKLLTQDVPRRGVLGTVAALTIGHGFGATDAAGKNRRNGRKNKRKGKRNGKGKMRKGGSSPTLPPGSPPPPPPSSPPAPPCLDGIRNGSESDIDCGGSCPRCLNGRSCGDRNDCHGAWCSNGTCQECATYLDCGTGAYGTCNCRQPVGESRVCTSNRGAGITSCADCPDDRVCVGPSPEGTFACFARCGAP